MANKNFVVKNGLTVGGNEIVTSAGALNSALAASTQSASDNTTKVATTAYVTTAVANLVDSSPSALNTLNELAAALGDDANYATTTTAAIAAKLPLAGGTLTGDLSLTGTAPVLTTTASNNSSGLRLNVTGQSSGQLFRAQNDGTTKFEVDHAGKVTLSGNLDANGNQLILDADADTSIREGADDYLIMKIGGTDLIKIDSSGLGIGIRPAEMLDIQSASGDARIRLDAPSGSDTEVKFFNAGSAEYTIGHDDATDNFVIGGANVDTPLVTINKSGTIKENDIPVRSRAIAMAMVFG